VINTAGAYVVLFAASAAFEFAYCRWARYAAADAVGRTVLYSVATAALGLAGIKGALELRLGWVPYLAGIAAGACVSAYLGRAERLSTPT
jgi:hypothetical protein